MGCSKSRKFFLAKSRLLWSLTNCLRGTPRNRLCRAAGATAWRGYAATRSEQATGGWGSSIGHGGRVQRAPNIPSRHAAEGRPGRSHFANLASAHGFARKITAADAILQAQIVHWQYVGTHQVEDQEHLGGPAANATNGHQFTDDGLVVHLFPSIHMHL